MARDLFSHSTEEQEVSFFKDIAFFSLPEHILQA